MRRVLRAFDAVVTSPDLELSMADIVVTTELIVAGVAVVLALIALIIAVRAWRRVRRVDRMVAAAGDNGAGIVATMVKHDDLLRELRSDLLVVHDNTQLLRKFARETLSNLGLVRYDAFQDLTGAMSFSLAMLDEQGTGVVVTSISGRNDSRLYAKPIEEGRCGPSITNEERQAVEQAVAGGGINEQDVDEAPRGRRAS